MTETDKKMPNRRENDFLVDTMIVNNAYFRSRDAVLERLTSVDPNAGELLDKFHELNDKLQKMFLSTIPERKWLRYEQLARHGKHSVDFPDPVQIRGMVRLVDVRDLTAVIEAAMKGECALCVKEGKEATRCKLRDALLSLVAPEKVSEFGCEYRDPAGALVSGRELVL